MHKQQLLNDKQLALMAEQMSQGAALSAARANVATAMEALISKGFAEHEPLPPLRDLAKLVLVQEAALARTEHTVNFLAIDGRVESTLCVSFVYTSNLFVKLGGLGNGRVAKSNLPCEAEGLRVTRELVRLLQYNGIGCVQYKRDTKPASQLKVIEVNARPCGSLIREPLVAYSWFRHLALAHPVWKADWLKKHEKQP